MQPCIFTDELSPDVEEALRLCAAAGGYAVQLRLVGGRNIVELNDDEIERLLDVVRRYDAPVVGLGSPFGKCELADAPYAEQLRLFDRLLRLADRFGARLIRVFAFHAPGRAHGPDHAALFAGRLPEIAERLREPAERARRAGRVLGLENEYTTLAGTCREARQVVDAVGSPALGIAWDVASGWWAGEPILPDAYAAVRGALVDVHVRDAGADSADLARHGPTCRLGEGAINWPAVIGRLRADGYAGPLTLETHLYAGDPDRPARLRAASVYGMNELRRLVAARAEEVTHATRPALG